jgi:hypothetical protein
VDPLPAAPSFSQQSGLGSSGPGLLNDPANGIVDGLPVLFDSDRSEPTFTCGGCGAEFVARGVLSMHLRTCPKVGAMSTVDRIAVRRAP